MAITITAAAVLSMFASLTLVPMLSGLFLNQAEAQQMFQGGDYSDRNWFESDRADIGSFRRLQSKLERFLLATVGWSLGPRRVKRRLALLSIPVVLLVASIFATPRTICRRVQFVVNRAFPGTSVPEAVNFLPQRGIFSNSNLKLVIHFLLISSISGNWSHFKAGIAMVWQVWWKD